MAGRCGRPAVWQIVWWNDTVGSSFTGYQGRGFWASDAKLELWLYLMCREIDSRRDAPAWLREARQAWHEQATAGFNDCVSAALDQHVASDPARAGLLRGIAAEAISRLMAYQPAMSRDLLNSLGLGGDCTWTQDLDPATLLPIAAAFGQLLAGTLAWDAASSPVL